MRIVTGENCLNHYTVLRESGIDLQADPCKMLGLMIQCWFVSLQLMDVLLPHAGGHRSMSCRPYSVT